MKYDAFISYRHLEKDMFVAKGIHKALETTRIPLRIRKEIGKKGIKRVFRDQEELPIGSSLSENIEAALAESEFLVVICSPQTKESAWVMKEIDTFIAMHGKQNILAVLVDGEPADSFPEQLLTDDLGNPREPLAADVRGNSKAEIRKKIKSESLRLAASILYCDYDNLRQRHRERIMRRYTAIAVAVAALGVLFGAYNAYNLARINENYQQKLINESKVMAASSQQALKNGDRKSAALIALEALPGEDNDRPFVADAMYALSEALGSYLTGNDMKKDKLLEHGVAVTDFVVNSDNTRLMSYDGGGAVYYWDVKSGEQLFKLNPVYFEGTSERMLGMAINDAANCVVSEHFFTGYDDEGNVLFEQHFPKDYIVFAGFSKSGNYLGACFRETAAIYDARTGELVKTFADEDILYSSHICFSRDDKLFGIETEFRDGSGLLLSTIETTTSNYSVYDIASGKRVDVTAEKDSILDVFYTDDECVAIASCELDNLINSGENMDYVQKYDYKTGECLWTTQVRRYHRGLDVSDTLIKSRVLDLPEGKKGELLVSSSRDLFNLDLYTGEITATYSAEDDIISYFIRPDNEIVYVGMANGKINFVDASTGYNYADYTIEVADSLRSFVIGSGYVIGRKYQAPDLMVLSYLEDDTKDAVVEDTSYIYSTLESPNATSYAYTTKSSLGDDATDIFIMDSETDKEICNFHVPDVISTEFSYLDDETIIATDYSAGIVYLDLNTGEMDKIQGSDEGGFKWVISDDKKVALGSSSKEYARYDLVNKKLIDEGKYTEELEYGYWYDGFLIDGGETVYYWDLYGRLYRYRFATGEFEILFENYTILGAAASKDYSKLVLRCGDEYARVADLSTMEIEKEISYTGSAASNYLAFSADNTKLYMQGADYYFRVYDLQKDEFLFVSDDQWNAARYTREIPEENLFLFNNMTELIMMDLDTYAIRSAAEYGEIYLEKTGYIVSVQKYDICKFKVKSLEDLLAEAKEKYGDAKLSSEQRLKYKLY